MAASGAKVLHLRCVEYARRYDIPIHVRSSFSQLRGHLGQRRADEGDDQMEQAIISGVAHDRSEAKITVVGVPDKPGEAAAIFRAIADAEINIDMIVQNVSAAATGLHRHLLHAAQDRRPARRWTRWTEDQGEVGFESLLLRRPDRQGLAGRRRHADATPASRATFFEALADAGVNIEMISTSEIRISVVSRDGRRRRGRPRRAHRLRPRLRRAARPSSTEGPADEPATDGASRRWPSSAPPAPSAP